MTDETEVQGTEGVQGSILDTPEMKVIAPEAQVHRGRVVSVETSVSEKGSTGIKFALESIDTGREDETTLWLPAEFVADIHVNPNDLPDEDGNNQRLQYTIGVSNSDKTATLQVLRAIGLEQKPDALGDKEAPTNFEEFVELHGELLSGIELIYSLAVDRKVDDPRFKNRLRVRGFYPMDAASNPKMFRRYKKAWEGQV